MSIEQRYAAFEKAKNYTKQYELDKIDSIVTRQEDDMLGYISAGQFATTGSNIFDGGQVILGNLNIDGDIIANQFLVTTSSITHFSASTNFGIDAGDTHTFTGSVEITGSLNVNTHPVVLGQLSWARYDDTQYTTSSFLSVTVADGEEILPNNGGYSITTHLHSDIEFYNSGSQRIYAEKEGDVYVMTVTFKAKTANANAGWMRIQMDSVGPTTYRRVGKDLFFGKGNDVWHDYHELFQFYADEDFVTHGNQWKVIANGATIDISDVIYFIQRTQNHLI